MTGRRVALVTGGGGAIGAAICEALSEAGHAVFVLDVNPGRAEAVAERLRGSSGTALSIHCDVAVEDAVARSLSEAAAAFGDPLIFVHAAGVGGPFHRADEVSSAEWRHIIDTNLTGAFHFASRLLPKMKTAGFGRVVAIASIQGLAGARLSSTYAASKHGLVGYVRALAAEWGAFGITANAVCPGYVNTAMGAQPAAVPGHTERILARTPTGRIAEPGEVASLVRYLASDEARHMNGAALVLDGGILADVGV